jgi:hypothetical protein
VLKAFYERLVVAGQSKKVALISVARKSLTILNAIIRDGTPWEGTVGAVSEPYSLRSCKELLS